MAAENELKAEMSDQALGLDEMVQIQVLSLTSCMRSTVTFLSSGHFIYGKRMTYLQWTTGRLRMDAQYLIETDDH